MFYVVLRGSADNWVTIPGLGLLLYSHASDVNGPTPPRVSLDWNLTAQCYCTALSPICRLGNCYAAGKEVRRQATVS
jgi:hypothetical protein